MVLKNKSLIGQNFYNYRNTLRKGLKVYVKVSVGFQNILSFRKLFKEFLVVNQGWDNICFCITLGFMPFYSNIKQLSILHILIALFVVLSIRPDTLSENTYQSFIGSKARRIANAHVRLSVKGLKEKSKRLECKVEETDGMIESRVTEKI